MLKKPHLINFDKIGDSRLGFISVVESFKNIPFDIKRVYWTYYTPNEVLRGSHAHKKLEQIIIAVSGVIEFELEDKNTNKYKFVLDNPDKGLFIPSGYWRVIKFSHNAVLLCLASQVFNEDDYIRDYKLFVDGK